MKMVKDFREFISKGNVVDMAVGVVVGGAFGKIVTSLVSDLIMPLVGLITGGGSLTNMFIVLGDKTGFDPALCATPELAAQAGFATLNYGSFIQTILDFLLIALSIFLVVKLMASMRARLVKEKEEAPAPVTTKKCPLCRSEIDIEALKCPCCTADLPAEQPQSQSATL